MFQRGDSARRPAHHDHSEVGHSLPSRTTRAPTESVAIRAAFGAFRGAPSGLFLTFRSASRVHCPTRGPACPVDFTDAAREAASGGSKMGIDTAAMCAAETTDWDGTPGPRDTGLAASLSVLVIEDNVYAGYIL